MFSNQGSKELLDSFKDSQICQDTVVLEENAQLLGIFSERREIESRRQLCEREKKKERELRKFGNETKKGTPANDQWRASTLEIEDSILSSEGTRDSIRRMFNVDWTTIDA